MVLCCMDLQDCDETEHASHASLALDMSVIFRPRDPLPIRDIATAADHFNRGSRSW
jgi:hypothetical protein